MKKLFFTILLLGFIIIPFKAKALETEYIKTDTNETVYNNVKETSDGGYFVLGDITINENEYTYWTKFDKQGNIVYSKKDPDNIHGGSKDYDYNIEIQGDIAYFYSTPILYKVNTKTGEIITKKDISADGEFSHLEKWGNDNIAVFDGREKITNKSMEIFDYNLTKIGTKINSVNYGFLWENRVNAFKIDDTTAGFFSHGEYCIVKIEDGTTLSELNLDNSQDDGPTLKLKNGFVHLNGDMDKISYYNFQGEKIWDYESSQEGIEIIGLTTDTNKTETAFYTIVNKNGSSFFYTINEAGKVIQKLPIPNINDIFGNFSEPLAVIPTSDSGVMFVGYIQADSEVEHGVIMKLSSTFNLDVEESSLGSITASTSSAKPGESIKLDIKPIEGYEIDKIEVVTADGEKISVDGDNFEMPNNDAKVIVSFKKVSNTVTKPDTNKNDIKPSNNKETIKNPNTLDNIIIYFGSIIICVITFIIIRKKKQIIK